MPVCHSSTRQGSVVDAQDLQNAPLEQAATFLSFDERDVDEVHSFVAKFGLALGRIRSVGVTTGDELGRSVDEFRIVQEIRRRYLGDADLTIVLIGDRTWTRRFVDWEIAASVAHGCALLGVPLHAEAPATPARLRLLAEDGRAVVMDQAPQDELELASWVVTTSELRWANRRVGRAMKTPLMHRDAHAPMP